MTQVKLHPLAPNCRQFFPRFEGRFNRTFKYPTGVSQVVETLVETRELDPQLGEFSRGFLGVDGFDGFGEGENGLRGLRRGNGSLGGVGEEEHAVEPLANIVRILAQPTLFT